MNMRETHYDQTVTNFHAFGSDDLHFVGYYTSDDDTLVNSLANLNRLVGEKLKLSGTSQVLDIGCGTGGPATFLVSEYRCQITGIDLGETQLKVAAESASNKGVANHVTFRQADAAELPFFDGSFDRILLLGSSSHMPDKNQVFAECARVAMPGAILLLADVVTNSEHWLTAREYGVARRVVNVFFDSPHLFTVPQYQDAFARHGFEVIEEKEMSEHLIRSTILWEAALTQDEARLLNELGKNQYKSMLRSIQIIGESSEKGQFGARIFVARRSG